MALINSSFLDFEVAFDQALLASMNETNDVTRNRRWPQRLDYVSSKRQPLLRGGAEAFIDRRVTGVRWWQRHTTQSL
jgi:hypothetical protein